MKMETFKKDFLMFRKQ